MRVQTPAMAIRADLRRRCYKMPLTLCDRAALVGLPPLHHRSMSTSRMSAGFVFGRS